MGTFESPDSYGEVILRWKKHQRKKEAAGDTCYHRCYCLSHSLFSRQNGTKWCLRRVCKVWKEAGMQLIRFSAFTFFFFPSSWDLGGQVLIHVLVTLGRQEKNSRTWASGTCVGKPGWRYRLLSSYCNDQNRQSLCDHFEPSDCWILVQLHTEAFSLKEYLGNDLQWQLCLLRQRADNVNDPSSVLWALHEKF